MKWHTSTSPGFSRSPARCWPFRHVPARTSNTPTQTGRKLQIHMHTASQLPMTCTLSQAHQAPLKGSRFETDTPLGSTTKQKRECEGNRGRDGGGADISQQKLSLHTEPALRCCKMWLPDSLATIFEPPPLA